MYMIATYDALVVGRFVERPFLSHMYTQTSWYLSLMHNDIATVFAGPLKAVPLNEVGDFYRVPYVCAYLNLLNLLSALQ